MLKLNIFNQRLSYFADSEVVADSKGYLAFTLETSEDWANYVGKTVQFTRDGKTYSVTNIMDNVEYAVPWEVLVGAGIMYVNAFAVADGGKRATTNQIAVEIIESGLNEDDLKPTDPTPDIFQQYVEQIQEDAEKAFQSAQNAAQSEQNTLNYKNQTQQIKQEVDQIKQDITSLNNQVNQAAQNAFQSAQSASESAQAASQSEIAAAAHESEAKQAAQDAGVSESNAETYMNAAKASETEATLQADRAQANQEIVTETKAEIDEIYQGMQTIQTDVTTKHEDVVEKAEQVASQAEQVENWYNNFLTGYEYVTFTNEMLSEVEGDDGAMEQIGYWEHDVENEEYFARLNIGNFAVLSAQMLNEDNQYVITMFVDIIVDDTGTATIRAIQPFSGRLQLYTLVERQEETV